MIPDYDRQANPRWPNHLDNPTHRARAVARMYRAHLRAARPDLCDQADGTARRFGETWPLEREELIEPEQELTTAEAAALVNVPPATIRKWACLDHPERPGEKLLPRFKKRGRETVYLAGKVLEAVAVLRRAKT
ncbi:hypothetical protein OOJ91_12185 [Micromonospora lupini]|uniref:hypothetical protein n=1 Tax=Micromonospora lupini TaxID=285679 RepID=UPI00225B2F87|nr:hypothetical protein [Micromonospora lupini]MCX5066637.1 hypothetical protein [Micromonospora lupini]